MTTALLTRARADFHARLVSDRTLVVDDKGVASNADGSQRFSKEASLSIARQLGALAGGAKLGGQQAGRQFEAAVESFVSATFPRLQSVRPGAFRVENVGGSRGEYQLARYEPYRHLDDLARAIEANPTLASVLGNSYEISPDVIVVRAPESDRAFNVDEHLVDEQSGQMSPLRVENQVHEIVHAVISCKWTLRSDRAQNARSEALNIIRNRKGRTPHIAVVTAEPSPSRIASLALGTGDLDTVYHFALPELVAAAAATDNDEAILTLQGLIQGDRLRDIADLPIDLAV